ncbi:MAG: hypothetical protein H6626_15110 [Pseudobdellovibrionaceae bacterium]|nr:hypothetical protein [Bdellovibrionales bacterium]USN47482.1 MAG: hypothetical protein H6626_15110 [Pseudobdellovibrionaceae bacterium]
MTPVHFHLFINHFPLFTIATATLFFVFAIYRKDPPLRSFALIVLAIVSFMAVPTYFSGEGAEEIVEKMSGYSESLLEAHEEAGEVAMVLSVILGVLAMVTFLMGRRPASSILDKVVVLASIIAIVGLLNAGRLGGLIKHDEIREGSLPVVNSQEVDESNDDRYEGYEEDHQ